MVNVGVSTGFLAQDLYIESSIRVFLNVYWIWVAIDGDQGLQSILKRRIIAVILDFCDQIVDLWEDSGAYSVSELGQVTVAVSAIETRINMTLQIVWELTHCIMYLRFWIP